MSRYLLIDIGAGTMDVLYYDDASGIHYKAVVESPVRTLAKEVENLPGNLLVVGNEMGGGPISKVLKERTRTSQVVMTESAAATIHHNPEKVRATGIIVIKDSDTKAYIDRSDFSPFTLGDLDIPRLEKIVEGFGVPFSFDSVGVCAQDHGVPPDGRSHLDYRHYLFKERLDKNPYPHTLLYERNEVPETFNRLNSIAMIADDLPADEIYVMDSGMAAILGASMDPQARAKEKIIVLDVATSHTVGAALIGDEIAGSFEYHTHDITVEKLDSLIPELANGNLEHQQILKEGGHGAYTRKAFGFDAAELIVATGPKRKLVENSKLTMTLGAPLGDNMMTGTVGLLEAIRRKKGLNPISYL